MKVNVPRLSFKSFYLSKIFKKKLNGGTVRIKQPKQNLFFGRLFAGKINNLTSNKTYIEFENGKLTISIDEKNLIHMRGPVSDIKKIEIKL